MARNSENDEIRNTIKELLESRGVFYEARFIAQSISRTPKEEKINWKILIGEFICDYSQGIGHIPGYPQTARRTLDVDHMIREACEKGKSPKGGKWQRSGFYTRVSIPKPDLLDVIHCLTMDSDVFEYDTFEDWAECYGMDTDSRSAETMYHACRKQTREFLAVVGADNLETFRELLQDY